MNLLLDTQCFLWFIGGDTRLSTPARQAIEAEQNRSYVSIVSLWEMVIKISLGKLNLAEPFDILIPAQLAQNGFELMNIQISHLAYLSDMPFHHRDPFDRLLIAQALIEEMDIVSGDVSFDLYDIHRLW